MMKATILAAASLLALATPALSAPVAVLTDPAAPQGNFQAPTNTARAGYTLDLSDDGSFVRGTVVQTGGAAVGPFANLYFDLNPSVGDGSDLGFEMGLNGVTAFIPGKNGQPGFSTAVDASRYSFTSSTDSLGLLTVNFGLANSLFTAPIAGLAYYPTGSGPQTFEPNVTLRLSQSLSYSVAGGDTYGPNRLGTVSVAGNVPEPAAWMLMVAGFGAIGAALRRRDMRVAFA